MLSGPSSILVQNWLLFPFIMAFATIITVFFYLSVPFVAGAIMKGLSGTTAALQAGIQGSMQAAGLVVGAGLTAAGAGFYLPDFNFGSAGFGSISSTGNSIPRQMQFGVKYLF